MNNSKKSQLEKGKWAHNRRVSNDKLIEGLNLLKAGIEDTIKESENQVEEYRKTLAQLATPEKVKK